MVLDGRNYVVPGFEKGFFVGPTIFDHVKPGMTIGDREVFGPVTTVKRCKNFEEGLAIMNANPYANGSVIFTSNGYYARQFELLTDGGMVGINVGIPTPSHISRSRATRNPSSATSMCWELTASASIPAPRPSPSTGMMRIHAKRMSVPGKAPSNESDSIFSFYAGYRGPPDALYFFV